MESSNNEIATVENGQVLAIKEGEVLIKATLLDKTSFCKVTVNSKLDLALEEETELKSDISNQQYLDTNNDKINIEENINKQKIKENKILNEKKLKEETAKEDNAAIEKKLDKENIKEGKITTEKELEENVISVSKDVSDLNASYKSEKKECIVNNDVSENNLNYSSEEDNNNEVVDLYTDNIDKNISSNGNIEENDIKENGTEENSTEENSTEENVNIVKYLTNKSFIFILMGLFIYVILFIKNRTFK